MKRVHEATTCKKWRGCDKSTTKEKVVGHFGEGGREKVGRWGAVMVREKVGLAAVEYPLWAFFGQDPSEVILAWIHLPEEGINMMYRAVSWGSAKKNGALHHLASHCQTLFYHYTSQRYQVHPRLSNFAICWQCLHSGWFVITNSRAKINKLIYDPTSICTMKTPLVM